MSSSFILAFCAIPYLAIGIFFVAMRHARMARHKKRFLGYVARDPHDPEWLDFAILVVWPVTMPLTGFFILLQLATRLGVLIANTKFARGGKP